MEGIILIGGGGHCKSVIDVIETENKYAIVGILDSKEKLGETVLGYKIIGTDNDIDSLAKKHKNFALTIGQIKSSEVREKIYNEVIKSNGCMPIIISPLAHISKYAKINDGTVIMHHAIVNASATIGKCCIINTKANIEHDVNIGDFCHISTGAMINGGVKIEKSCFIGSNSTINHDVSIPQNSIIGSNSTVNKTLTISGTYVGCPAKKNK